jgi:sugar phosphate isomerase/epimerase
MNLPSTRAVSRREFIGTTAAIAGAGIMGNALAQVKNADPYGGFTVGVQSYCFRNFDREQTLKRIQALGLNYVELYQKHAPLQSTPEQIQAILRMCKDYDITPVAYGVQEFTKDHDKNKQQFDFGKMLGIKFFSANPKADSFDSLDKLCDEYKIGIAIHPHGPIGGGKLHEWYSAEIIMDAVKNHHPLIGSCLDTGHLIRAAQLGKKLDPAQQVRVMGARNFGIHLKDHDNETKTDVIYGKGVLDVPEVLKALKEVKFQGWISIEYEAHPENPSTDMEACLQVLRDAVKKVS